MTKNGQNSTYHPVNGYSQLSILPPVNLKPALQMPENRAKFRENSRKNGKITEKALRFRPLPALFYGS